MDIYNRTSKKPFRSRGHRFGIHRLSRCTGISASHISKIFNGQRFPSIKVGAKLARSLGITLDRLYEELAEPKRAA